MAIIYDHLTVARDSNSLYFTLLYFTLILVITAIMLCYVILYLVNKIPSYLVAYYR